MNRTISTEKFPKSQNFRKHLRIKYELLIMQKFYYFMNVRYMISFAIQVPEYNALYFSSSNIL